MQIPLYNLTGEVLKQIEISDKVFAVPFNESVVHQVMVGQLANARQGTASTKTRSEVHGTSKKMYRQKHTGSARAGTIRSPLRRKGGVTFGPKPREFRLAIPKKMRRLALRCLLSAKAGDGELKIVDALSLEAPKTKLMAQALAALGVDSTALIVTPEPEATVIKSARNLPGVKTMPANILNALDLLNHKVLLMTEAAVRKTEQLWGEEQAGGEK